MKILFNGRTIAGGSGGVQKWSGEIHAAMIRLANDKDTRFAIESLAPKNKLFFNGVAAYAWEQFYLPTHLDKSTLLFSPGNVGPVLVKNQAIVIHDLIPFEYPEEYSKNYRTGLKMIYKTLLPKVSYIFTVSNQQKELISNTFEIDIHNITNVGAGVRTRESTTIENLQIDGHPYYLFIGGSVARKNVDFLIKIWPDIFKLTGIDLVVVGRRQTSGSYVQSEWQGFEAAGVRWIFDPTDEELNQIYANSLGLLHPSKSEGFGLPLLEAASFGKSFLASGVGAAPELAVGRSKVLPLDAQIWINEILDHSKEPSMIDNQQLDLARKFSWDETAKKILINLL